MATIQIYEGEPSRESVKGVNKKDADAVVLNWIVLGTRDDLLVKALVQSTTPAVYDGLLLQTVTVQETAPEAWQCQANYAQKESNELDYDFSFDTTGGKQKITQSLETVHRYASSGKIAPDHKGAIGVTEHGVEGCDIVVPRFSWQETWKLPIADYGWEYSQVLSGLTGMVNAGVFRGFPAGQVLFHGARGKGSTSDEGIITITYHFERNRDVTAQTIGDITGINKGGWHYLWVQYEETDDNAAKTFARRPVAAYVERVYESTGFGTLAIGS
ncbi:MAG: hypothetical protein JW719_14490 [Pirellulales bacterium]|nr:hypothetical protein [Pirellulales bacterium]